VLNLKVGKVFALIPYFPAFSAEPQRREGLCLAFRISLPLVLNLNVGKVFDPPSLYLVLNLNVGKVFAPPSLFPYI